MKLVLGVATNRDGGLPVGTGLVIFLMAVIE